MQTQSERQPNTSKTRSSIPPKPLTSRFPQKPHPTSPMNLQTVWEIAGRKASTVRKAIFGLCGNKDALKFIATNPLNTDMGLMAIRAILSIANGNFSPNNPAAKTAKEMMVYVATHTSNAQVRSQACSVIKELPAVEPKIGEYEVLVSAASNHKEQISRDEFEKGLIEILEQ
jgi:hypothetical protein